MQCERAMHKRKSMAMERARKNCIAFCILCWILHWNCQRSRHRWARPTYSASFSAFRIRSKMCEHIYAILHLAMPWCTSIWLVGRKKFAHTHITPTNMQYYSLLLAPIRTHAILNKLKRWGCKGEWQNKWWNVKTTSQLHSISAYHYYYYETILISALLVFSQFCFLFISHFLGSEDTAIKINGNCVHTDNIGERVPPHKHRERATALFSIVSIRETRASMHNFAHHIHTRSCVIWHWRKTIHCDNIIYIRFPA